MRAAGYLGLIVAFLVVTWLRAWDRDIGGYADSMRTRDKAYHALGCFAACLAAIVVLGVLPWTACLLTILGGAGFEVIQRHPRDGSEGYFSWRDVLADAGGALVALLAALAFGWGR